MELFGDIVGGDAASDLQSVMWDCDDLLLVLFDYYASLNADGRISSMTFNEWGECRDTTQDHHERPCPCTPTVPRCHPLRPPRCHRPP